MQKKRVKVLMNHPANRDLLMNWASDTHELANPSSDSDDAVDIIIVDKGALIENHQQIKKQKSEALPIFLPVMLVSNTSSSQEQHKFLSFVDTIVESPVNIMMFNRQLDVLFRTRKLSQMATVAQDAEHEQRVLAETLQETAIILTSTLDTEEVFNRILQNIGRFLPLCASAIVTIVNSFATIAHTHDYTLQEVEALNTFFAGQPIHQLAMFEPLIQDNEIIQLPTIEAFGVARASEGCPVIIAPIILNTDIIGFILVELKHTLIDQSIRANHLKAFAAQAAIAIQNSRLYAQSQTMAVIQERERLARDFHDSITQALFSASVISEAIKRSLGDTSSDLADLLGELHLLTRGALAETRTLILELKPTKILETDLSDLLKQLAESIWSRKQLALEMDLIAEQHVPLRIKVAFYRIAQEAFHNIVKHSRASRVSVEFDCEDSTLIMVIKDNGIGFELDNGRGLGLSNMAQRAKNIDATFDIISELGNGTTIQVTWQDTE